MPQASKQKQTEKASEPPPDQQKVKTLFVSGLPNNVREREIYLLFRGCKGYEGCVLNTTGKQPVCFVVFKTHKNAVKAMEQLQVSIDSVQVDHYDFVGRPFRSSQ
jgi:RNA recognition motif-containing protein